MLYFPDSSWYGIIVEKWDYPVKPLYFPDSSWYGIIFKTYNGQDVVL